MASFIKLTGGRWQVQIARKGVRKSKICPTKRAAQDWAAMQESAILNGASRSGSAILADVFKRYSYEVSPTKRGERWERLQLRRMSEDKLGSIQSRELTAQDVANWRDRRLQKVAAGTLLRERNLLSAVLTTCRKEWGLIGESPVRDVRWPKAPPRRNRLVTEAELEALAISAGSDATSATARAFMAFRFSIETAMRAGEVVGLEWNRVDLVRRVAHLPETKNGEARDVPLSSEAVSILEGLPRASPVFGLRSEQLEALWRKLRDRAGVVGLTYHDSRHSAITQLAKKLDVLDLARVVGHRDLKMLLVYYEADAEALAKKLD